MFVEEKYDVNKHFLIVDNIEVYPEEESLREYLLMNAHKDINNHLSQTYLLFDKNDKSSTLLGYYTIKTFGFATRDFKENRLYYYPCVELSQLLIDIKHRNKGYGNFLINLALEKTKQISDIVGCKLLIAFSLSDASTRFYTSIGFKSYNPYNKNNESLLLSETGYHDGLPILGIEIN